MHLVRATSDHLDVLVNLFDQYRQFYRQESDLAGALRFLGERLERDDSVIFLALNSQHQGMGFTQLYPSFSSVSMKRVWILNDLYVSQDHRRQGVAKALMDRARQLAVETKAKGIVLETEVANTVAQPLYEQLGYSRDSDTYHYQLVLDLV